MEDKCKCFRCQWFDTLTKEQSDEYDGIIATQMAESLNRQFTTCSFEDIVDSINRDLGVRLGILDKNKDA